MDSLTHTLKNLNISDDWYSGEDLCNENQFLEKSKKKIEEIITSSNCSFDFGKSIMTFSAELAATPTAEIAREILKNVDEVVDVYYVQTKILREIGWCSSYMLDKRACQSVYLVEFSWLNISRNCRLRKKLGQQCNFVPFFFVFLFQL